jgi:hypothetical protein
MKYLQPQTKMDDKLAGYGRLLVRTTRTVYTWLPYEIYQEQKKMC